MIVDDEPIEIQCRHCKGSGWSPWNHGSYCSICEGSGIGWFDRSRLFTLAHNLAVVGALFASFRAGDNFGFHMGSDETQCTCQWSPGRGEPYRGSTRCEQDAFYDDDWQDLEHELAELADEDPDVAAAADRYDEVVADITRRDEPS